MGGGGGGGGSQLGPMQIVTIGMRGGVGGVGGEGGSAVMSRQSVEPVAAVSPASMHVTVMSPTAASLFHVLPACRTER